MYDIDFYIKNDISQVLEFIDNLRQRKDKDKDARVQYTQISSYIQLLADNGTSGLPENIVKHLEDGIWELRPGKNRVFLFFYNHENKYVLLHQFRKKSQKTPAREIKKAKIERLDYLQQKTETQFRRE
ncbi:MAG: type II toxin-antitoxin system RelE/ParE family toxin [Eubacterium sp.]|nr:type II toxin-antitoxin system RelE/ParE family toxin [Eubacterium sp.]